MLVQEGTQCMPRRWQYTDTSPEPVRACTSGDAMHAPTSTLQWREKGVKREKKKKRYCEQSIFWCLDGLLVQLSHFNLFYFSFIVNKSIINVINRLCMHVTLIFISVPLIFVLDLDLHQNSYPSYI